jgi:hypothetical protein
LQAKIYEFEPAGPVLLTQISQRQQRSRTSDAKRSSASTFRTQLLTRDEACVITRQPISLVASHLIPKRMVAAGATAVVSRFAGAHAAAGIHEFDATIGIMLVQTLDTLVDVYQVGFYHVRVRLLCLNLFTLILRGL